MAYKAWATRVLRVIHWILHDRRSAGFLRSHSCEAVELGHVHLQGWVQIRSHVERSQERTYLRFRNHREMRCVVFIYLFTVTAQIPGTIHTVEPLPSNEIYTQITEYVRVYDVS